MINTYIPFEKDSYKEVLRFIKDQSVMLAHTQSSMPSLGKRKLTHDPEKRLITQEINLPSIQNSTLKDISLHFHSISKKPDELEINRTQQRFIQDSFNQLEQTKMGLTVREISQTQRIYHGHQRKVPPREPQSVRYLEIKLGSYVAEKFIPKIVNPKKQSEHIEELNEQIGNFFEETVNSYSYAVPSRRESSQMVLCRDRLYVYGGMSGAGLTTEMWWFDLKKQEWNSYQVDNNFLRTGHSMIMWKNQLIIFGGSQYYDAKMKIRQVFSNIGIFNTFTNTWSFSLESVEPRREHKAILWNTKYMIVTGGLDAAEQLLNDTLFYSLDLKKWVWPKVFFEEGIAQHAVCLGNDYKHNCETVYLFGGRTKSLGSFGLLRLVFTGLQPSSWEKVVSSGIQPSGRYNHTMENTNDHLILIGGRSQSEQEYQNDIFLFQLIRQMWVQVKRDGLQTKRWSHSSCVSGSQIMCFGGIGEQTYLPPHLYQIETDPLKIRGKIVVMKKKSDVHEKNLDKSSSLQFRPQEPESKRTCKLERYRNTRKVYEKVNTYIALPELKTPKMRYDLLIHFVKGVLMKINYL